MTSTLERSQNRRHIPVGPSASIPDDNSQFKVQEPQMVTSNFQPEIMKTEPVNIAPSPVPTVSRAGLYLYHFESQFRVISWFRI